MLDKYGKETPVGSIVILLAAVTATRDNCTVIKIQGTDHDPITIHQPNALMLADDQVQVVENVPPKGEDAFGQPNYRYTSEDKDFIAHQDWQTGETMGFDGEALPADASDAMKEGYAVGCQSRAQRDKETAEANRTEERVIPTGDPQPDGPATPADA